MNKTIFRCINTDNDCPKKDQCERYLCINDEETASATLFKVMCTEENNRILFMGMEEKNNDDTGTEN